MEGALKKVRTTTNHHFRKGPMTKRTVDLIIRIGIEIVEWISTILKEKRRNNDSNMTNLPKTVEDNILDPLKEYGYIKAYERMKGFKGIKYIIHRNPEKKSLDSDSKDAGSVKRNRI